MPPEALSKATCVVRNTASRSGRTQAVAPGATPTKFLHYGRIRLDATDAPIAFNTGEKETGLICLSGSADVTADGQTHTIGRHDAIYIPRDCGVAVKPGTGGVDFVEVAAPVERRHPVQVVLMADIRKDPTLHVQAGGDTARR